MVSSGSPSGDRQLDGLPFAAMHFEHSAFVVDDDNTAIEFFVEALETSKRFSATPERFQCDLEKSLRNTGFHCRI
ncbi:MAG: hypothetical protein ACJAQ9_000923 [Ilumatobacter sp.]